MKLAALLIVVSVIATSSGVFAVDRATLRGIITSPDGTPLEGAHIFIVQKLGLPSQTDVSLRASATGEYAAALKPGVYDVMVTSTCSAPTVAEVSVQGSTVHNVEVRGSEIVICDEFGGEAVHIETAPSKLPNEIKQPQ